MNEARPRGVRAQEMAGWRPGRRSPRDKKKQKTKPDVAIEFLDRKSVV